VIARRGHISTQRRIAEDFQGGSPRSRDAPGQLRRIICQKR
jgi:hypothetical protein